MKRANANSPVNTGTNFNSKQNVTNHFRWTPLCFVAGIPRTADTWAERARQDHDLEDFLPDSDEEIGTIAAFLHGQEDATSSALSDDSRCGALRHPQVSGSSSSAAALDEPPDGTADEDSWDMASSSDVAKHHKLVQVDRFAFELGSGTQRPDDIGGSGYCAAIRT
jgi:hypothetical protein